MPDGELTWVGGGFASRRRALVECEREKQTNANNMSTSGADMESRVAELEEKLAELSGSATDLNVVWIVISSVLVFFMQVGFAMVSVLF